ncbi:MAG TPA: hypothetical protein VGA16_10125 [Candidatus Limnocylindria bacterium]
MSQVARSPLASAVVVFVIALAFRAVFASGYLWAWDSVLYARAIGDFDVASGRPHPPGYLFYVLLARAATWSTGEANAGLVLVSMIAGAATCAAGFLIGARIFGAAVGVLAAAILIADPLLWHYSEVAYPYTVLAVLSGSVGALLWRSRGGGAGRALGASLALGLAAGFRQDLLLLLGPMWVWTLAGRSPAATLGNVAALALGCLMWLAPSAWSSGGLDRYLAVTASQVAGVSSIGGSEPQGFRENALMIAIGLRWQLHWLVGLAPLGAWMLFRRADARGALWPLALWITPAVLAYLVFHIGEWAYTLSVAVPLALLAAVGGTALMQAVRSTMVRPAIAVAIGAAIVLNAHSFVLGAGRFSARAIEGHDAGLAIRFAEYRARFPATDTVIIADGGYQHARYYLSEYRTFYVPAGSPVTRRTLQIGPEVRRAMLFLGEPQAHPQTKTRTVALGNGVDIHYVPLDRGSRLVVLDGYVAVEDD